MDADAKKTALRMIPYGLYVLTADADGDIAAATVNWVTQTSFEPPLVAVGVKVDSHAYSVVKKAGGFALNMLGKDHGNMAFTFFKPAEVSGHKISGEPFHKGVSGAPVLDHAIAAVECKVVGIVEKGDHHTVIGEVTQATVYRQPEGRADLAILHMADLGEKVFYGG